MEQPGGRGQPRPYQPPQEHEQRGRRPQHDRFGPPPSRRGGPSHDKYGSPPPRPRKRRAGRVFLIILILIVALLAALWIYVETSLNRVAALSDYEGRPAAGAGTNWLIVGSDSREGLTAEDEERLATGDTKGQRTDTIMLLHIPDNDVKPTLVSLLRDSYVDIPGKGKNKLNAAYAFGGPALLAKTVETNTKLRLDHYIEIGFGGFESVVDAVGGVDMCLPEPLKDPLAGIDLAAGCQELSGADALGYVRTRVGPRADLDRVIRQREFLSALTDKATSAGTLINPFRLIPLVTSAPDAATLDEGDHLHNLPSLAFAMGGGPVTTTVPMGGSKRVQGAGAVILWDAKKAPRLFEALNTDVEVPADLIVGPPK